MKRTEFEVKLLKEISCLKAHSRHFTQNTADSDDLIQETMLKALRFWNSFKDGTNFKGWLYTIMRNTFINGYRLKSASMLVIKPSNDFITGQIPTDTVRNLAESNMQMNDINAAINKLSNELSAPFSMYFTGYRYHEIADLLAIPMGTVKTRIHLARKVLQKSLRPYHYKATA